MPAAAEPPVVALPQSKEEACALAEEIRYRPLPGVEMDAAAFERWAVGRGVRGEWADGMVFLMAPAADDHDGEVGSSAHLLRGFVNARRLGRVRTDKLIALPDIERRRLPDGGSGEL